MPIVNPITIKYTNFLVGTIAITSAMVQFVQVYLNFTEFLLGMSAFALSIPIIVLEFKVPPDLNRYASFYFSFLGRGLLYILLSFMLGFGGGLKIVGDIILFLSGVSFISFHYIPSIEEPSNFRPQGGSIIAIGGDDDLEDDLGNVI